MSASSTPQTRPGDTASQIEELERQKLQAEINQLRAGARTKWITPAALTALLPLVGGFSLWILAEVKQFSEGYRAIAERDALEKQKAELQRQKDSLNLEVSTLLQLKSHYAAEAERLKRHTEDQQSTIDNTWLRGVFTRAETIYALQHAGKRQEVDDLQSAIKELPEPVRSRFDQILSQYSFAFDVIDMSRDIISEFDQALDLMPTSEWTKELQAEPTGAVIADRKIMSTKDGKRYYDVMEGRFLTDDEVRQSGRSQ